MNEKRLVYVCEECSARISPPAGRFLEGECPVCGSVIRRPINRRKSRRTLSNYKGGIAGIDEPVYDEEG